MFPVTVKLISEFEKIHQLLDLTFVLCWQKLKALT